LAYIDPLICALGSFVATPLLFLLILATRQLSANIFWLLTFLSMWSMGMNYIIVGDILIYVIYPTKRSLASSMNMLICHVLGDASSPYIIGAVSVFFFNSFLNCYLLL
jgi:MFS transporter, Spinster family, sphingosine-1-phosphate transporter